MSFLTALSWIIWIGTCDVVAEGYYDALSKEDPRFHVVGDRIGWGVILSILSTTVGTMAAILECITIPTTASKLKRRVTQRREESSFSGELEIGNIGSFSDAIEGTSTVY